MEKSKNFENVVTEVVEKNDVSQEVIKKENDLFLKKTFESWYGENEFKVETIPTVFDPRNQDFEQIRDNSVKDKFGEYTVNPEMQGVDFEHISPEKIKTLQLSEFVGKQLYEVAKHIINTYGSTHHIPGLEFWKWVLEEYENASDDIKEKYKDLKDGNHHHFLGSIVRDHEGHARVPNASWNNSKSEWDRSARWLGNNWDSEDRIVLFEK